MIIDPRLRDTVDAIDLSTWSARCGATALSIVLLQRIWHAESMEPVAMESYLTRFECESDEINELEDNLRYLDYAISMLYRTYGLPNYQRLGICNHLHIVDAIASCNTVN